MGLPIIDMSSVNKSDQNNTNSIPSGATDLAVELARLDSSSAAVFLETLDPKISARALRSLSPVLADKILSESKQDKRIKILEQLPNELLLQWAINKSFAEDSVGRLMDPPQALFAPELKVSEVIENLRELVKKEFITYVYAIDNQKRLVGIITMRELLFAESSQKISSIMISNPFSLNANTPLMEAMKEVLIRHFPVYPVCNDSGELIGLIRGNRLFEAQAIEISAQAGSMVGVEKEEKLTTPWTKSFKYRHPWLQLNLLTAFIAGGVVSVFQNTIDQMVVLAAFLPVLAGQSGNTGCQALAVTLRGMTLGELKGQGIKKLLMKEAFLGFLNGAFVGVSAGLGMYLLAKSQGNPNAFILALIVVIAMIGSCLVSGLSGALVPLVLRKLGADPATASSIFLTTATDVASMGMLLSLATWILL